MLIDFGERGREGQREGNITVREKHVWLPLTHTWTRDYAYNLGMCPDRKANP